MNIEFCGHSCFIISEGNHAVIIDPFILGNPKATRTAASVKADGVLLTHGHGDHVGDGVSIAVANNAVIVAPFELALYCQKKGAVVHPMHIGGSHDFHFGRVKLTHALHGSAVMDEGDIPIYTGNPCGFLLTMGEKTIYHAGDTGLFGDMELIGERNKIDVAMLPIGDNFTMGIQDALYALKLINPHKVIPMHYNTFSVIETDVNHFISGAVKMGYDCVILNPGESLTI